MKLQTLQPGEMVQLMQGRPMQLAILAINLLLVVWNASLGVLNAHFDGERRLQYEKDLVTNIFGGEANVIHGLTAANWRPSVFYFCDRSVDQFTLLHSPSYECFEQSMKRYERMLQKYPDHKLVFSTETQAKWAKLYQAEMALVPEREKVPA